MYARIVFVFMLGVFFVVAGGVARAAQLSGGGTVVTGTMMGSSSVMTAPVTSSLTMSSLDREGMYKVTTDLLAEAGFVSPVLLKIATNTPVFYFQVKEAVTSSYGWGSNSSVVAVFIEPKLDKDWYFNYGKVDSHELVGKTQVRLTTGKNYIVVTGPDKKKTETLAHNLSVLF